MSSEKIMIFALFGVVLVAVCALKTKYSLPALWVMLVGEAALVVANLWLGDWFGFCWIPAALLTVWGIRIVRSERDREYED